MKFYVYNIYNDNNIYNIYNNNIYNIYNDNNIYNIYITSHVNTTLVTQQQRSTKKCYLAFSSQIYYICQGSFKYGAYMQTPGMDYGIDLVL